MIPPGFVPVADPVAAALIMADLELPPVIMGGRAGGKAAALELAALRLQARRMPCHDHEGLEGHVVIARPRERGRRDAQ